MTGQIAYPTLRFAKMHGLGNDFVVIDARDESVPFPAALAQRIGDRHFGVGFDQMVLIHASDHADLRLEFYNTDGSMAGACGNATRCVAAAEMARLARRSLSIETERGQLAAKCQGVDGVSVNMGAPLLGWEEIPLARAMDTLMLPLPGTPTATGMGNPHCSFFVEDVATVDLSDLGYKTEHDPLFPERTNVQIAQVIDRTEIRMRVWERGVGVTLASGSSACAVAVAAVRRGLTERSVTVSLDGGRLSVDWRDDGVWMTGPTAHVFDGELTGQVLDGIVP